MYDMKATVAYIPKGRVIGLSKIARICDMAGRRLQLQERLGRDIADILGEITGSTDIAVLLEGRHSCVSARGIKNECKNADGRTEGPFQRGTGAAIISALIKMLSHHGVTSVV